MIRTLLQGFVIGLANIIPGVSGGTMALVLGIYERLIRAVNNLGPQSAMTILSALKKEDDGKAELKAELKRIDFWFLSLMGVGAVGAIVATSKLITILLESYREATYGFFCGLILISIIVPFRMMKGKATAFALVTLILGVAVAAALGARTIGDDMVDKARRKAVIKGELPESVMTATDPTADDIPLTEKIEGAADTIALDHSPAHLAFLFIAGALAISAMILPGVSGSFLLLVMGVYFDILAAIEQRDLLIIAVIGAGCGIGLLVFSRFLNWLLKLFHDPTMTFLGGLMVGSLYGLWPFRNYEIVAGEKVSTTLAGPASTTMLVSTLIAFIVGCAIVAVFLKMEAPAEGAEPAVETHA